MKYSVGAYKLSEYINYKYFDVSYNVRLCNTLAGMNSELVNIRVHQLLWLEGRFKSVSVCRYNCEQPVTHETWEYVRLDA